MQQYQTMCQTLGCKLGMALMAVTIYDITGNAVGEVKHNEKFNVTHLPSGVYFVRTATQATKFIKH